MMFKASAFAAVLLACVALPASAPALAQDIATRILNIENRLRDLTGQMEELNHSLQQLQTQMGGQKQGDLVTPPATAPVLKKLATNDGEGIEAIEDVAPAAPAAKAKPKVQSITLGDEPIETENLAPGPTNLASGEDNGAGNGGQLVTAEGAQDLAPAAPAVGDGAPAADLTQLASAPAVDTPEAMYEKYYETLLRRQFGEAEAGFRDFLQKYPDHSLAGSAQYQLGETFYAQGNYQDAARNFLQGYKTYPKSRRAPDSLLKLGLSLRKLDQRDQACAALASVSTEFPRAVEAKKRAQAELKRAGC